MKLEKDYEELLGLLNDHEVRYCIIGSFALAFHVRPRYTKDIDILVDPAPDNASRLVEALGEFGLGSVGLEVGDFSKPNQIVQLGYEPVRIDIITSIEGLDFEVAWKNRVMGQYGSHEVSFIGLDELILSKKLAGRAIDLADLELLEEELPDR